MILHTLTQAADDQQRHGAGFGNTIVDQRGLADATPMASRNHHAGADAHLQWIESVRQEASHNVSLLTINIARPDEHSQVLLFIS